jgi:hypothetical protein
VSRAHVSHSRVRVALALAAAFALTGALSACALPDTTATVVATCPDRTQFTSVSPFVEVGCGTIDCHGAPARPLRIYGFAGLRLSPNDVSALAAPTTTAEVSANWLSACSLQPEQLDAVVSGQAGPDSLLLVQKPRLEVHHKGGAVVVAGDPGDTCITSWLSGEVDAGACAQAKAAQER